MSGGRPTTVAILCGGRGTRLRERTESIPKPVVEIGGRPIVWHVMQIYASLATLACSHASLVTGARRATDSEAVSTLVAVSIGLAAIDALAGILALAGVVEDDVDEGVVEVVGVLVIALLLTTVLPPILRRLQGPARPPSAAAAPAAAPRPSGLAAEVLAAADRIELLSGGDERVRAECERLRALARAGPPPGGAS